MPGPREPAGGGWFADWRRRDGGRGEVARTAEGDGAAVHDEESRRGQLVIGLLGF